MTAPDHVIKPLKNILREWGHPYMALRDEGAYRGRCRLGSGAHGHGHRRQRSRHQSDGGACCTARRAMSSPMPAIRERTSDPNLTDRDVSLEHRDQAQHHQGVAESGCRIWQNRSSARWRRCGPGSSTRSTSSRTCSAIKKLRYRGLKQEHRAAAHPVRAGQPGDRQENPARPMPCLITPEFCLDPGNDTGKPRYKPQFPSAQTLYQPRRYHKLCRGHQTDADAAIVRH